MYEHEFLIQDLWERKQLKRAIAEIDSVIRRSLWISFIDTKYLLRPFCKHHLLSDPFVISTTIYTSTPGY